MAEVCWLGAFAYLFNSISVFSVFLFPYAIQHDKFITISVLPIFALLSFGASVSIIKLTNLIYEEKVGQQFIPDKRSRTEVDLPTLIRYSLSRQGYDKVMYVVAVFCYVFIVAAMSVTSAGSTKRIMGEEYWFVWIFLVMLFVSIMNNTPFWLLKYFHIVSMVCRLIYCGMRIFVKMEQDQASADDWLFVPCLVTIFFYQLSLPRVLEEYHATQKEHIKMQLAVLIIVVIASGVLVIGLHENLSADRGEVLKITTQVLYMLSKWSAPQIYWHAMSRILIVWYFEIDFKRVKYLHPLLVRGVQSCLHFVAYIVAIIFLYFKVDLFKHSLTYLISMPLIAGVTYCSLSFSHRYYLKELNKEVDWWIWVLIGACVALFVYGVYNVFQNGSGDLDGDYLIYTLGITLAAMCLSKLVYNFWDS